MRAVLKVTKADYFESKGQATQSKVIGISHLFQCPNVHLVLYNFFLLKGGNQKITLTKI